MQGYSSFTEAYRPENLNKEPRVSLDVPQDIEEWRQVLTTTPIIVLYLWSENCRPCLLIRDKYENLARELASPYIRFYKDNINQVGSFHRTSVEVVPTFIILSEGKEVGRYSGWNEEMKTVIISHLQESSVRYQEIVQSQPPRIICKNNVCYIQND
jgi:thioredoxin-like negative regulator of GroEL